MHRVIFVPSNTASCPNLWTDRPVDSTPSFILHKSSAPSAVKIPTPLLIMWKMHWVLLVLPTRLHLVCAPLSHLLVLCTLRSTRAGPFCLYPSSRLPLVPTRQPRSSQSQIHGSQRAVHQAWESRYDFWREHIWGAPGFGCCCCQKDGVACCKQIVVYRAQCIAPDCFHLGRLLRQFEGRSSESVCSSFRTDWNSPWTQWLPYVAHKSGLYRDLLNHLDPRFYILCITGHNINITRVDTKLCTMDTASCFCYTNMGGILTLYWALSTLSTLRTLEHLFELDLAYTKKMEYRHTLTCNYGNCLTAESDVWVTHHTLNGPSASTLLFWHGLRPKSKVSRPSKGQADSSLRARSFTITRRAEREE